MPNESPGVPLASAISALRNELDNTLKAQEGDIRFEATEIALKLQTTVTSDVTGQGGIKWWLVNLGGETARGTVQTQEVTLTLRPVLHRSDGMERLLIDDE